MLASFSREIILSSPQTDLVLLYIKVLTRNQVSHLWMVIHETYLRAIVCMKNYNFHQTYSLNFKEPGPRSFYIKDRW